MVPLDVATCHSASLDPCSFATSLDVYHDIYTTEKKNVLVQRAEKRVDIKTFDFFWKGVEKKKKEHVLRVAEDWGKKISMCEGHIGGKIRPNVPGT